MKKMAHSGVARTNSLLCFQKRKENEMGRQIEKVDKSWRFDFIFGALLLALCVFPLACGGGEEDENLGLAPSNSLCSDFSIIEFDSFYIAKYEASRPDAEALSTGINDSEACSKRGVMPWYGVSDPSVAKYVCQSSRQGGRLCSKDEWLQACGATGEGARVYPYGNAYISNICNTWDNEDNGVHSVLATRYYADCTSPEHVHDMSGNLMEWIEDTTDPIHPEYLAMGGSVMDDDPRNDVRCDSQKTEDELTALFTADPHNSYRVGFRCCIDKP
ncbi:MAG: SUMF1/EgtB/PvdO family nonheme iron enzyme [bacterium]|nr:SUMF1/EgtB/PvdO family nonheme iron enzyme [bacterium]